jgi:hypothetical protein
MWKVENTERIFFIAIVLMSCHPILSFATKMI